MRRQELDNEETITINRKQSVLKEISIHSPRVDIQGLNDLLDNLSFPLSEDNVLELENKITSHLYNLNEMEIKAWD